MCFPRYKIENNLIHNGEKEKIVVGMKQTLNAIARGELERILVAHDADAFVTNEIITAAEEKAIPISYVESMKRLGKECGIDIGASCAGVLWSIGDPHASRGEAVWGAE